MPFERTVMAAEVQREVGPQFGCVFWDWQQAQGGEGSMIWLHTDPPQQPETSFTTHQPDISTSPNALLKP